MIAVLFEITFQKKKNNNNAKVKAHLYAKAKQQQVLRYLFQFIH